MADSTNDSEAVAGDACESVPVVAVPSRGVLITGPVLLIASSVAAAMLVAETIFGLLWSLNGKSWISASFLQ